MRTLFLIASFFSTALATAGAPLGGNAAVDRSKTLALLPQHPARQMLTIPAQTEAEIHLLSGIHSRVSHEGDQVLAQLSEPIYVDGRLALPAGTLIDGRITRVRSAGRLRRPGEMTLRFERITLPDGQNEPFSAILTDLDAPPRTNTHVDSEGFLKGTRSVSWRRLTAGFGGLGALSAIEYPLAGAAAVGATIPIGGGAVLGYSLLWPKGNEVHVPPDTQMKIRLRNPLTVRVAW